VHRDKHVTAFELEQIMAALGHAVPPLPPPATPEALQTTLATLAEAFQAGRNGQG